MTIAELKEKYVDYLVNRMEIFIPSYCFTDMEKYGDNLGNYTEVVWNIIDDFHLTEDFIDDYRVEIQDDLDPDSFLRYIQSRINQYFEKGETIYNWDILPLNTSISTILFNLFYNELYNTVGKAVVTRYFPKKMMKEGFIDVDE